MIQKFGKIIFQIRQIERVKFAGTEMNQHSGKTYALGGVP